MSAAASPTPSLLERIQHLVERESFTLPVLSEAGLKLQGLAARENYDMAEVERLIMNDQALAAEVLRAANSVFFGGLTQINTIRQAALRVGMQQVVKIVFLVSERAKYHARDPQIRTLIQTLWRSSSTAAIAADWLARRLKPRGIEEAFLGGLLHDVGELVILRALDEFKASEDPDFVVAPDLIHEVTASAHAVLGYEFLKQRRIPEVYCLLARDHHRAELDPGNTLMAIIRLADHAVRKCGFGMRAEPQLILASTAEAACLNLDEIVLAELEVMLEDAVAAVA